MRAETVRRRLRPYIGDVVDNYKIVSNTNVNKYEHLHNCIILTDKYKEVLTYLDIFLRKFTADELNDQNFNGMRLFSVIVNDNFDYRVIELLVKHGIDINLPSLSGLTPLSRVVYYYYTRHNSLINCYIENGADINKKFTINGKNYTILMFVINDRIYKPKALTIDIAKKLIDHGADINVFNDFSNVVDDEIKNTVIEYYNSHRGLYTKLAQ